MQSKSTQKHWRTCGICGKRVAYFTYGKGPFGLPVSELHEVDMGRTANGGKSDYRCSTHSGQRA